MVSITLSIPEDVRELMKKHDEVNWSGSVRKFIIEKALQLELKEKLLRQLESEREFNEWAVAAVRKGRKGRMRELERKGFL